jgi:hypothetical protein
MEPNRSAFIETGGEEGGVAAMGLLFKAFGSISIAIKIIFCC